MRNKKGFTLIELLVVVAIIGVLATIVLASLGAARSRSRDAQRKSDLNQIRNAISLYSLDNNVPLAMTDSGCAAGANAIGFFDFDYGNTNGSMKDCLSDGGYLPSSLDDPQRSLSTGSATSGVEQHRYMMQLCTTTGEYLLMANLEAEEGLADVIPCTTYDTQFGMDYFVVIK